jgi:hypothetical protein
MTKLKDATKEVFKEYLEGTDLRHPKKFVKYQWGQFKRTMFIMACVGGYILYTGAVRGW